MILPAEIPTPLQRSPSQKTHEDGFEVLQDIRASFLVITGLPLHAASLNCRVRAVPDVPVYLLVAPPRVAGALLHVPQLRCPWVGGIERWRWSELILAISELSS